MYLLTLLNVTCPTVMTIYFVVVFNSEVFFRGLNPFLKDQLAERELLSRFNSLIASEQDRQRMAAMSAAYPPGNHEPLS